MKRWITVIGLTLGLALALTAGTDPKSTVAKGGRIFDPSKTAVAYAKQVAQGFNMQVWLSNQMTMGLQAWDLGGPPIPQDPQYGLEYPVGTGIEHMYGAGPWIGGIVNGVI